MRVFQKNFQENSIGSNLTQILGYGILFFIPKTHVYHPSISIIAIVFFSIITIGKILMVLFSKGGRFEYKLTFALIILSAGFWSTLFLVELLAQPTLNQYVVVLFLLCALVNSGASLALYKNLNLVYIYFIIFPGLITLYTFLFLSELKIMFGLLMLAATIFLIGQVKKHNKNWENFLAEKEKSEKLAKKLETQTKELTQIKTAIDNTSDAVGISTHDGSHFYQNKAFTKMFGYSTEEIKMLHPKALYSNTNEGDIVFKAIMAGNECSMELEMITKNSKKFPVDLRANAVKNRDGDIIGLIGIHTDITQRKIADEALVREMEKSNSMAKEAEKANLAKSEFLANMSHEIRTPMNGIIGMSNLLLDTQLNEEQREFAKIIQSSGDALLNIINDILDYSKIEAGKYELESIDFDLRLTMDKLSDLAAIKAQEKHLEFICIVDHKIYSLLMGDPGRLRQILINLTGNAIKFTEQGEIIVDVSLEKEDTEAVTLRFGVTDTGIGIPENRIDAIFQSFSQVDSSTTRKYGGTGLGLTISKQLAEMMGGEMHVKSIEGTGSEFWFTAVFKKQTNSVIKQIIVPENIKSKHILIVDDNDTNRYLLKKQLQLWGCRYDEASSGKQALEKFKQSIDNNNLFEIAILDMQMPKMDGETLGAKIKQDPETKSTELVLMTSMGNRGDAKRFGEIGFAAYLTKPVKQSQLFDCLALVAGIKQQAPKRQKEAIITQHSLAETQSSKNRILLAEDNIINQKVANITITKLGYHADTVNNGKEAIEALLKNHYSVILMDCQMPEMDGYKATQEIRKLDSEKKDIPIIAMTANAMEGDRKKCIEAGMNDYLSKPVKPKILSEILKKWIKEKV